MSNPTRQKHKLRREWQRSLGPEKEGRGSPQSYSVCADPKGMLLCFFSLLKSKKGINFEHFGMKYGKFVDCCLEMGIFLEEATFLLFFMP